MGIGAFALLPSQHEPRQNESSQTDSTQNKSRDCGHKWLLDFLQSQIGAAQSTQTGEGNRATYPVADMAEMLYVQEAARIPYYGMRQVLYPDLTMTVALGKYNDRFKDCFKKFKDGVLRFYHLPEDTFKLKYQAHVIDEIQFLVLIPNHCESHNISIVWPVRSVKYLPRNKIDDAITGQESNAKEPYILFELGKPFSLMSSVNFQHDGTFRHSIKLTMMKQLEQVKQLDEAPDAYREAMV